MNGEISSKFSIKLEEQNTDAVHALFDEHAEGSTWIIRFTMHMELLLFCFSLMTTQNIDKGGIMVKFL